MRLQDLYGNDADGRAFASRVQSLEKFFLKQTGEQPEEWFSSSGRAEICGNHTDHNHGKVLVAAISCDILAAVKKRNDGFVRICSAGFPSFEFHIADLEARPGEAGKSVALARGWEIIPVENLLAQSDNVLAEAGSLDEARLAAGILERGVDGIVVLPEAVSDLKAIVAQCKVAQAQEHLQEAVITRVEPVGLGHRVCADTISLLRRGQGMLVGNSSAFTFLVHAETEHNEYVAARPFRVNAGAVHAYARLPHDRTCYLGEFRAVLQNAETIRLTAPGGVPMSVVDLKPGDVVLCRTDEAGRHFGMRIQEEIREV